MSTKIYNAYRIKKDNVDILKVLKELKELTVELVSKDWPYLRTVHHYSVYKAKELMETDTNAKWAHRKHTEGDIEPFWIERLVKQAQLNLTFDGIDANFECSVFYDDEYWYLKFFSNQGWSFKMLKEMETRFPFIEDYHYQNQTDTPDDVTYEEFELRGKKWDSLLESSDGDYMDGFSYTLFNATILSMLLQKYHYTGEKDLYKHLAYKFDEDFLKEN